MGRPASSMYLFRRSGWYYFRISIPDYLQMLVGVTEIRYSLRTGSYTVARLRALQFANFILPLMERLRRGCMQELSSTEIRIIIRNHFRYLLDKDEEVRLTRSSPRSDAEMEQMWKKCLDSQSAHEDILYRSDYKRVASRIDSMLQRQGLEIPSDSLTHRKLCHEYCRASVKYIDVLMAREEGDFDKADALSEELMGQLLAGSPVKPQTDDNLPPAPDFRGKIASPGLQDAKETPEMLSRVIKLHAAEQERGGNWTAKTTQETLGSLNFLTDFLGDIPVASITDQMMVEFKQALMKLPPQHPSKATLPGEIHSRDSQNGFPGIPHVRHQH